VETAEFKFDGSLTGKRPGGATVSPTFTPGMAYTAGKLNEALPIIGKGGSTVGDTFTFDRGNPIGGRLNLLTENQSSIETDTSGFKSLLGATLTRTTSEAKFGNASLQVETPGEVHREGVSIDPYVVASEGETYTGSVYIKGAGELLVLLQFYDLLGAYISQAVKPITVTSDWQRIDVTGVAPSGTAYTELIIRTAENNPQAVTFYIDGLQIEQGPLTPWHLGGTSWTCNYEHFNTAQGTISFWIKPFWDGDDGNYYRLLYNAKSGGDEWFSIYKAENSILYATFRVGGVSRFVYVNISSWNANTWHHILVRYNNHAPVTGTKLLDMMVDGTNANISYNNVESGVDNWLAFEPSTTIYLGTDQIRRYSINSLIDDFCIWDEVLSDEDVAKIYNAGVGNTADVVATENLKAYFKLDGSGKLVDGLNSGLGSSASSVWSTDNLIQDGHMEDAGVGYWTGVGANLSKDTSNQLFDTQCLAVEATTGNGYATKGFAVSEGESYTLTVWYKSGEVGVETGIRIQDVTHGQYIRSNGYQSNIEWEKYSTSFVVPKGCTEIAIRLISRYAGDIAYFDRVSLVPNKVSNGGFEYFNEPNFPETVGHWRFNEDTTDESGNGNTLTLAGSPTYTTGYNEPFNTALQLNGVDQYAYISDAAQVGLDMGTDSFTITARVAADNWISDSTRRLVSKRLGGRGYIFYISNTNKLRMTLGDDNGHNTFYESPSLNGYVTDGEYSHLGVVLDRSNNTLQFYINGQAFGSPHDISYITGSLSVSADFKIGVLDGDDCFAGKIDEIHIIKRALSASEIQQLAGCANGWKTAGAVSAVTKSTDAYSGSSSQYVQCNAGGIIQDNPLPAGYNLVIAKLKIISGTVTIREGNSTEYSRVITAAENGGTWNTYALVTNYAYLGDLYIRGDSNAEFYVDDISVIPLSSIDATATPATEANSYVDGKWDQALQVSYGDALEIPTANILKAEAGGIGLWMYLEDENLADDRCIIEAFRDYNDVLYVKIMGGRISWTFSINGVDYSGNSSILEWIPKTWYYIAITWNLNTGLFRIYRDGTSVVDTAVSGTWTLPSTIHVGVHRLEDREWANARFDYLETWDHQPSDEEINLHYTRSYIAKFGIMELPVHHAEELTPELYADEDVTDGGVRRRDVTAMLRRWELELRYLTQKEAQAIQDYLKSILYAAEDFWLDEFGDESNTVKAYIDPPSATRVQFGAKAGWENKGQTLRLVVKEQEMG